MHVEGRKVSKGLTEQRIIDALEPGYHLIRVNWKKRRIHVVNGFGTVKVIALGSVAR
jgi:hypothetical protein